VIWVRNGGGGSAANDIYFTTSADGGQTFTEPKNISHSPPVPASFGAITPDVAGGPPGHVYVAWEDVYELEPEGFRFNQTFFSHSSDGGETFSPPQQLSFRTDTLLWSGFPHVAGDAAGRVYVGWHQLSIDGGAEAFVRASPDAGQTFLPAVNLSERDGYSHSPALAVDAAGTLYAAWPDDVGNWEIMFRSSSDGGQSFSPRQRLSRKDGAASTAPAVAGGAPGRVYISWDDYGRRDAVLVTHSRDGGQLFRTRRKVPHTIAREQHDMAADTAGIVYVVYTGALAEPDATWAGIYFTRTKRPLR